MCRMWAHEFTMNQKNIKREELVDLQQPFRTELLRLSKRNKKAGLISNWDFNAMNLIAWFLVPAVLTTFISCNVKQADNNKIRTLPVSDFEQMLHTTAEKIVLDVRAMPEYQKGHLPNSVLLDVKQDDFESKIAKLDKSTPIFVYCEAGVRSEKAANILLEYGFTSVYHLQGGIQAWEEENKQVIRN